MNETTTPEAAANVDASTLSDLLPCPFCGGTPEIAETEGVDYIVYCKGCGVTMSDDMEWSAEYDGKQNVTDKWNAREHQMREGYTVTGMSCTPDGHIMSVTVHDEAGDFVGLRRAG